MKTSDAMCGALRIVHFEVKEDSGSLAFKGAIPVDVKSFSATLHYCYLSVSRCPCVRIFEVC